MQTAFLAAPPVLIPVKGDGGAFPVRRIYCIGRNYADHVREMGNDPKSDPPLFFMKPADAIVLDGRFPYPPASGDVHHELELVVALKGGGEVFGYAVGLDMTRRDLQAIAKQGGRPWEAAKAFDHSAPVSAIAPIESTGRLTRGAMTLDVNGVRRQAADFGDMIWSVDEIVAELQRYFTLKPGDLIFTGTPAGVGPVKRGDRLHAVIEHVGSLDVEVV
jgi:fumarylpyruvate hydrolase